MLEKSLNNGSLNRASDSVSPIALRKVGHWVASLVLKLSFQEQTNKTVLSSKQQLGPYTIQRPLYPEQGVCHLILLHPPGGLVEGDTLSLDVDCGEDTHTFITTPSAGKVYQCDKDDAGQHQHFTVRDRAKFEWFPQELILFDKSLSVLTTDVHLEGTAQFAGWEMLCLGREIAGDYFSDGRVVQNIRLFRDNKPLLLERFFVDDRAQNKPQAKKMRQQAWGLSGYCVTGTLIISHATQAHLEQARAIINQYIDCTDDDPLQSDQNIQVSDKAPIDMTAAATLIDDLLVVRGLAQQSRFLKDLYTEIWSAVRLDIMAVEPLTPRIWQT